MDDKQKRRNYEVEWSFSFEDIGRRISETIGSLSEEPVHTQTTEPIGETRHALIHIGGSVGRRTIRALEDGNDLLAVDALYSQPLEIRADELASDGTRRYHLRGQKDSSAQPVKRFFSALTGRHELYWDVALSPRVPMRLSLEGGVGPSKFDLTGLDLTGIEIAGGVGQIVMTLPTNDRHYSIEIDSGVGETIVNIPALVNLTIEIEGGIGQTVLNIAAGVAVRLEAESGIGSIRVPESLRQIDKDGDFGSHGGTWESEGFALARNRVVIRYDGGIGSFVINHKAVEIV